MINLSNTYSELPDIFYEKVEPIPVSDPKVIAFNSRLAKELGIKEIDNKNNFDAITISNDDTFQVKKENDLLEGVNVRENNKLKAIPYYAWSNRGIGKMKVWLPKK